VRDDLDRLRALRAAERGRLSRRRLFELGLIAGSAAVTAAGVAALDAQSHSSHPAAARTLGTGGAEPALASHGGHRHDGAGAHAGHPALDSHPAHSRPLPVWSFDGSPVRAQSAPAYTVSDLLPHAPRRAIALTVDDGPDPYYTPTVLDLLAEHRVRATFNLVGVHVDTNPGLARDIVARGHAVSNHTMHHLEPFTARPAGQIRAEISAGRRAIVAATGVHPALFRAPGGAWDDLVFRTVARQGMRPVDWDVDPRDWSLPGVPYIVGHLLAARPGDIVLCHDGGGIRTETIAALRIVLPILRARHYEFVALDPRLPVTPPPASTPHRRRRSRRRARRSGGASA
jgi:peptidoglycan/xylan/chitin deacetylase (PgdA/CDA1 family)